MTEFNYSISVTHRFGIVTLNDFMYLNHESLVQLRDMTEDCTLNCGVKAIKLENTGYWLRGPKGDLVLTDYMITQLFEYCKKVGLL